MWAEIDHGIKDGAEYKYTLYFDNCSKPSTAFWHQTIKCGDDTCLAQIAWNPTYRELQAQVHITHPSGMVWMVVTTADTIEPNTFIEHTFEKLVNAFPNYLTARIAVTT